MDRVLRVGILQGGQLVEERVVRQRGAITIGPSASDTFILPLLPGSRSCVLFSERAGRHELHLLPGCDGRVALDDGQAPLLLSSLRQSAGPRRRVRLGAGARGKLTLGDTTILFQLVEPPPAAPRPRLPSSVRGSLRGNFDWILIGVVGLSVFSHAAFVVYLRSVDRPRPTVEDVPERVATASLHLWRPIPRVDPKPVADQKTGPTPAKVATGDRPHRPVRPATLSDAERVAREKAQQLAERARFDRDVKRAVVNVIGVRGVEAVIHDGLEKGDPSHDASKAFEGVRGTTTAQLKPGLSPAGFGQPPTAIKTKGDLTRLAMNDVESGEKKERTVKPSIKLPREPGGFDPETPCSSEPIVDGIRLRKGGLVACYEKALHRDPTLQGKVRLRFSVTGAGRVSDVDIEEDTVGDEEMAGCLTRTTRAWLFAHTDACGKMQFSYPFVFTPAGNR